MRDKKYIFRSGFWKTSRRSSRIKVSLNMKLSLQIFKNSEFHEKIRIFEWIRRHKHWLDLEGSRFEPNQYKYQVWLSKRLLKYPGRQISINLIFHGVFSRKLRKFNSSTTLPRKKNTFLYVAKISPIGPKIRSRIRLDHGQWSTDIGRCRSAFSLIHETCNPFCFLLMK